MVKLDELDGFEEYFAFVLMESLWRWNLLDQRMHWTTAGGASDDLSRSQSDNKKSKVITDIKGVLIKDKKTVMIGLVLMFTEAVEESKVWK